jgi:hypothetical protein
MLPVSAGAVTGTGPDAGASADFLKGYVKGFLLGGWSVVEGLYHLGKISVKEAVRLHPVAVPIVMVFGDRYESELRLARAAKDLAVTTANVALGIQQDQNDLMIALLVGDLEAMARISEPYRLGLEFTAELLKALGEEYASSPPEKQGEIFGRAVFEVFSLAVVYAKAGQLGKISKLELLTKLKTVPFFQDAKVAKAFTRITGFLEDLAVTKMCFVAGTKVHTASGLKNIEDVRVGEKVLSRDPRTREQAYKPVLRTVVTHPTRLYHVTYRAREHASRSQGSGASSADGSEGGEEDGESSTLVATGEHPFFVAGTDGFVPVERLNAGDLLTLAGGGLAEVLGLGVEESKTTEPFTTYNFEVEGFGTYFVGGEGVWVHNAAANACMRIRSLYVRLRSEGKTPNEIFRALERRLAKKAGPEFMGEALDEALRKDVFPDVPAAWTKGKFKTPGENVWDHFTRHVRQKGDVPPGIEDPVTYAQKARGFVDRARQGNGPKAFRRPRDPLDLHTEQVLFDPQTGEFAVVKIAGPEAGAVKTYYIPEGDAATRFRYFLKQVVWDQVD